MEGCHLCIVPVITSVGLPFYHVVSVVPAEHRMGTRVTSGPQATARQNASRPGSALDHLPSTLRSTGMTRAPGKMGEGAVEEKPGLYLGNHTRTQTQERLFLPHLKDFRCSLSKTPRQFSGRQGPPLYLHSRGKAYSWCLVSVH